MSDQKAMNTDAAINVMARWAIREAYKMWAEREDLWENEYPDFGIDDVQEIVDRMGKIAKYIEKVLPIDVTLEMYQEAHKVLADRAEKQEEV